MSRTGAVTSVVAPTVREDWNDGRAPTTTSHVSKRELHWSSLKSAISKRYGHAGTGGALLPLVGRWHSGMSGGDGRSRVSTWRISVGD